jgi:hypothetical protein
MSRGSSWSISWKQKLDARASIQIIHEGLVGPCRSFRGQIAKAGWHSPATLPSLTVGSHTGKPQIEKSTGAFHCPLLRLRKGHRCGSGHSDGCLENASKMEATPSASPWNRQSNNATCSVAPSGLAMSGSAGEGGPARQLCPRRTSCPAHAGSSAERGDLRGRKSRGLQGLNKSRPFRELPYTRAR